MFPWPLNLFQRRQACVFALARAASIARNLRNKRTMKGSVDPFVYDDHMPSDYVTSISF